MDNDSVLQCAARVMDTFHMMMRTIKPETRSRSSNLSMQQFRAMKVIERHEGASLSLVSDHLGATLSATSKLVDGLVDCGYICRETAEDDRRKLILALTDAGMKLLESVHMEVLSCLAEKLTALSPGERSMLTLSMDLLRSAFIAAKSAPATQSTQTGE